MNADNSYYLFLPSEAETDSLVMTYNIKNQKNFRECTIRDAEEPEIYQSLYLNIGEQETTNTITFTAFRNLVEMKNYTFSCTTGGTSPKQSDILVFTAMKSAFLPSFAIVFDCYKKTPDKCGLKYLNIIKTNSNPATLITKGRKIDLKKIKGRGNSTWKCSKKPYNLNLKKAEKFFTLPKSKKFSLLANCFDESLIRNSIALTIADKFEFAYTPKFIPIDLFVEGMYLGTYLLTEKVEIGKTRVNIDDIDSYNELIGTHADSVTGEELIKGSAPNESVEACHVKGSRKWSSYTWTGVDSDPGFDGFYRQKVGPKYSFDNDVEFLVEFDFCSRYDAEVSGFVTNLGQNVVIHSPEFATKRQVNEIADYYQRIEDAIYSDQGCYSVKAGNLFLSGCNSRLEHFFDLIDVDSFVKMYVLLEYTMNSDSGLSSTFFYKKKDKFYAGPAWDFDNSMLNDNVGTVYGIDLTDPEVWWANTNYYSKSLGIGTLNEFPTIFSTLFRKHVNFRTEVTNFWRTVSEKVFNDVMPIFVSELADQIEVSAVMNSVLWNTLSSYPATSSNPFENKRAAFLHQAEILSDFITTRRDILTIGFNFTATPIVFYDSNGGEGYLFNDQIDTTSAIIVRSPNIETTEVRRPGYEFVTWNTRKNGSGTNYAPGSKLSPKIITVLFAQWRPVEEKSSVNAVVIVVPIVVFVIFAAVALILFFLIKKKKIVFSKSAVYNTNAKSGSSRSKSRSSSSTEK